MAGSVPTEWWLSGEERRRGAWERRGLVEQGGCLTAACRVCGVQEEVYTLEWFAAVEALLDLGWLFEDRYTRRNLPWLWSCPDH